jgi:hypothetical protein
MAPNTTVPRTTVRPNPSVNPRPTTAGAAWSGLPRTLGLTNPMLRRLLLPILLPASLLTACAGTAGLHGTPSDSVSLQLPHAPRPKAAMLYVLRQEAANRGQLLNVYLEEPRGFINHGSFMSGEYVALHLPPGNFRVCVAVYSPATAADEGCYGGQVSEDGVAFVELEAAHSRPGVGRYLYALSEQEVKALLPRLRPSSTVLRR